MEVQKIEIPWEEVAACRISPRARIVVIDNLRADKRSEMLASDFLSTLTVFGSGISCIEEQINVIIRSTFTDEFSKPVQNGLTKYV
jgi:hypothetical protein